MTPDLKPGLLLKRLSEMDIDLLERELVRVAKRGVSVGDPMSWAPSEAGSPPRSAPPVPVARPAEARAPRSPRLRQQELELEGVCGERTGGRIVIRNTEEHTAYARVRCDDPRISVSMDPPLLAANEVRTVSVSMDLSEANPGTQETWFDIVLEGGWVSRVWVVVHVTA